MRHRVLTILAVISLVLCTVILVLWVLSYTHTCRIRWGDGNRTTRYWIYVWDGRLYLQLDNGFKPVLLQPGESIRSSSTSQSDAFGLGVAHGQQQKVRTDQTLDPVVSGQSVTFWMSLWWPLLPTLAFSPCWVGWYRKRRRYGPGHCQRCGYDLRASQDRCPECGTPIPVKAPTP